MPLDPEALRRLRSDLRSEDASVRAEALARIEQVIGESSRALVAEALASDDPEVRAHAERLLERLREAGID
jgi:hypothetical protein